ncbi:hypothetical protein DH2020_014836 [Rehmannia glutinosa]|uniref:Rab-GAP TBC domain-containing protein n=1 Tax=Rehmannia glutinosa TaxID=99300 RepID=A0ABR0WZ36_REHGL
MPETASCSVGSRCFGDLRGVQWRVDLGILPSSPSATIDDLRRVTANSRRRYASLRKQLLVDPHVPKRWWQFPDPVMDNPLSQNPDSMWGRFFRNAELERMLDQDLTRLYPERGSYFQTSGCQGMLRRILLLWCLRHPEYGYRQGMHELLAPLLYVLHVDVEHLSEVRKAYEDHFVDNFDGDAYGAEGELGIVLSEKFMEHDAYSMFDALMSGAVNLLVIWDETFACDNTNPNKTADTESYFRIFDSPRGAFISAFAVSMILKLRSSLLATENATICLQRLLNFPNNVNLPKLISKAKSLQALALDVNKSNSMLVHSGLHDGKKTVITRGHTLSLDSASPRTPLKESYWEEKWRVLHKEEEQKQGAVLHLSRTESDPSPSKKTERTNLPEPSVRRSLLDDLARQLESVDIKKNTGDDDDNKENAGCNDDNKENAECNDGVEHQDSFEVNGPDVTYLLSEENTPNFSGLPSPVHGNSDEVNESESSSVASNSSIDENALPRDLSLKCTENDDSTGKSMAPGMKERKVLSGKFQWLWKFGRNANNEGTSKRPFASEDGENGKIHVAGFSMGDGCDSSSETSKGEIVDQNLMVSLRNLGQSMLENIQVIESVFGQDCEQLGRTKSFSKNGVVGKEQVTAMSALKELRKISSILSEM